ncbi:MAG TPA: Crp/Fnr family transcriptional regulator [Bacteroidales bacterium]|jgi:CRP-like cAMP-binding protein|nr:Crp/Fnr family transcriptional regulator [Bacteroidales bacterium]
MPIHNLSDCANCTGNWENFRLLKKEEMQLVESSRYEAAFRPGEMMIKQGSPATHALFMANGMAKTYIEGIAGKNFMMGIALPGRMILSPGAFTTSRHTFSVAAITKVKACFIGFDTLKQVIRSNGIFAESLLTDMSFKSLNTHRRMVNQSQKRMSGRLAEILLYFADDVFHNDEYEMILSRQELGELAGMAKECVVRILKEFEESGVISSKSSGLKILDREKLTLISEKG